MDPQLILSLLLTCAGIASLIIAILKYKGRFDVIIRIRMPLVMGLEESRETLAFSFNGFPFSSLEDGLRHLKWVPVEIHNESPSRPVSINLVWMEVLDSSAGNSFKKTLLNPIVKEHLPVQVKANSYVTLHFSIRTVAEIWKEHIHQIGVLRVRHSSGTYTTAPFHLDSFWQYYRLVAKFVGEEVLKQKVKSLKHQKMQPQKLVDYVNNIYGRLGFVPDLGAVRLLWILEKEKNDSFFKPYQVAVRARLAEVARQTTILYQKSVKSGKITPPKEKERIPICIIDAVVPKNTESILELIEELEKKD